MPTLIELLQTAALDYPQVLQLSIAGADNLEALEWLRPLEASTQGERRGRMQWLATFPPLRHGAHYVTGFVGTNHTHDVIQPALALALWGELCSLYPGLEQQLLRRWLAAPVLADGREVRFEFFSGERLPPGAIRPPEQKFESSPPVPAKVICVSPLRALRASVAVWPCKLGYDPGAQRWLWRHDNLFRLAAELLADDPKASEPITLEPAAPASPAHPPPPSADPPPRPAPTPPGSVGASCAAPEAPAGSHPQDSFLGFAALCEALDVHESRREAFRKALERLRRDGRLADGDWRHVTDRSVRESQVLYRTTSPVIQALAHRYRDPDFSK
jgi:hypothetical protein